MNAETTKDFGSGAGRGPRQNGGDADGQARATFESAAREARGALEGISRSMPDMARASRGAMDDAWRAIETASDERLSAGMILSLGLTIGLLIGGAPRLLVALALVPLAAIGLSLADRQAKPRPAKA